MKHRNIEKFLLKKKKTNQLEIIVIGTKGKNFFFFLKIKKNKNMNELRGIKKDEKKELN